MLIDRRKFVLKTALGLVASGGVRATSSVEKATLSSSSLKAEPRRYVINGNMVIPGSFGDPLDDAVKQAVKSTGLTAFKLSLGGSRGTYDEAHEILDSLPEIYKANPDIFLNVNSASDLQTAYDSQKVGIIYSFEAATMMQGKVENIKEFADRGVRIMQLGYNNANVFGAGVMSTESPLGLTELGREAVIAMQSSNVLIDLSHAHKKTSLDVLKMARRPVAMTHTGCDAINPHQRNKDDIELKAMAETGGVIGIYEMSYLTPDLKQQSLDAFMAHLFHALKVCGEDHVGIGSDTPILGFDTSAQSMAEWNSINEMRKKTGVAAPGEGPPPFVTGLNGVAKMNSIADELVRRGLSERIADKVIGANFARVFGEAW